MSRDIVSVTFDRQEIARIARSLKKISTQAEARVLRSATNAAASPLVKDMKQRVVKVHGLLKKSLGKKGKTYKQTSSYTVFVGPRSGFNETRNGKNHDPVHYAHLVEGGTFRTAPKPFMRPAVAAKGPTAKNTMIQRITSGVNREIQKQRRG